MRFSAPLLTLAGTVAGTAAAVVAYQATAAAPATKPASATTDDPAPLSTTSWLPCDRGWKVEGTTCVRIKEKVVVVQDLPARADEADDASEDALDHDAVADDDADENEVEHADDDADENEVEHADDDSSDEADDVSEDVPDHEDVGDDD